MSKWDRGYQGADFSPRSWSFFGSKRRITKNWPFVCHTKRNRGFAFRSTKTERRKTAWLARDWQVKRAARYQSARKCRRRAEA
jgi:hypothetical protein